MNLQEVAEYYQDNDMKHFTCPDCTATYIGLPTEHEPSCVSCRDCQMVPTSELAGSLINFLKYA